MGAGLGDGPGPRDLLIYGNMVHRIKRKINSEEGGEEGDGGGGRFILKSILHLPMTRVITRVITVRKYEAANRAGERAEARWKLMVLMNLYSLHRV